MGGVGENQWRIQDCTWRGCGGLHFKREGLQGLFYLEAFLTTLEAYYQSYYILNIKGKIQISSNEDLALFILLS